MIPDHNSHLAITGAYYHRKGWIYDRLLCANDIAGFVYFS